MPIEHLLILGAALFCMGLLVVLSRKNAIAVLIGIELMLNASNINLVAFSHFDPDLLQGQIFALFVITVAAAEAAVGLAIVVRVYQYFQTADLDQLNQLNG